MQYTWTLLSVHVFVASGKLVRVMHDSLTSDLHLCPEYEDKWLC